MWRFCSDRRTSSWSRSAAVFQQTTEECPCNVRVPEYDSVRNRDTRDTPTLKNAKKITKSMATLQKCHCIVSNASNASMLNKVC
uniref:Secreted protein n=1 Tax=Steinernema glaseri TaxID=37863 RepID=A0A1I8AV56_9BILA